jgi:hypothetical protein
MDFPSDVRTALLLISIASPAARIAGYRRHRIKGFVFPAIVPASEADEVQGLVREPLTRSLVYIAVKMYLVMTTRFAGPPGPQRKGDGNL